MTTKSELKKFFENGDVPDQEQFWAWMDSYWHKEEDIDPLAIQYSNPNPSKFTVGGVPAGTVFENMPLKVLLDYIFYGLESRTLTINPTPEDATVTINGTSTRSVTVDEGSTVSYTVTRLGYFPKTETIKVMEDMTIDVALEADLTSTEIKFTVKITVANEKVPVAMLRTFDTQTVAKINYGDDLEELISVPKYEGTLSWTDNEGNVHQIDNGSTFYHTFEQPGTYSISINAGININYVRFCEGFTIGGNGYLAPKINSYIQQLDKFRSNNLTNLDYTFAGLSQANVAPDFKLETPEVTTMNATFYGFGVDRVFSSFPANMLSLISKPKALHGTFFKAGLLRILPGFLDSFADLESVFECFKNSKLGRGHFNGIAAWDYNIPMAVNATNDFIPVSLFWKNPKLQDISHVFNYIGEGWFGNLSSGYLAMYIVRRELFWNGKSVGNTAGTIRKAFYAFAKCNRVICEPNLLKHAPEMIHLGGIFTQTNHTNHALSWGGILPVAASETEVYHFSENGGIYNATVVSGKGLTFDLNVIFPAESYPNVLTLNGAFTAAAIGNT